MCHKRRVSVRERVKPLKGSLSSALNENQLKSSIHTLDVSHCTASLAQQEISTTIHYVRGISLLTLNSDLKQINKQIKSDLFNEALL